MAERKVQSKYIPADYDHRVLQHLKKQEPKQRKQSGGGGAANKETVRLMLPFNVCCANCSQYMYRGRKFNAKKEVSSDNDYLGTKRLLFHIKCEHCSNPIVFRTDPASSGFAMVSGARENKTSEGRFNPLADVVEKDDEAAELEKQNIDAMAALEARALETRQEMEKITELTLAMQRSAQREARLQQLGNNDEADKLVPTLEEEQLIASFREQQRMQQLNQQTAPLAAAAAAAETEQDQQQDIIFTKRKRVKVAAKPVSFVTYDSDSDDE